MPRSVLFPALLASFLAACTVGPNYEMPPPGTPAGWVDPPSGGLAVTDTLPWWREFHDPSLDRLVDRALADSVDLKRAQAVVEEARASLSQAKAGGMPQLGGSLSRTVGRVYSNGYFPENYGAASFDASWEVDLWGKTRRSVEAAKANQEAAEANLNDARLTLLGEVARNYFEIRGSEAQVAAMQVSLANRRRAVEANKAMLRLGDGTEFKVLQAETFLLEGSTTIASLEADIQVSRNALAILCGMAPAELGDLGGTPGRIAQAARPSLGIPADLVRRRPDVRAAERQLAQAVAQIGVAVADKYPAVTIGGNLGLSGASLASILAQPIFAVSPAVSLPIFDGGKRTAVVEGAKAKAEEARLVYRSAVLKALQDVEDAMARLQAEEKTTDVRRRLVASTEKEVVAARLTFQLGDSDFLAVLDAQRGVDSARISQIQSETNRAVQTVALFKALGGGWNVK